VIDACADWRLYVTVNRAAIYSLITVKFLSDTFLALFFDVFPWKQLTILVEFLFSIKPLKNKRLHVVVNCSIGNVHYISQSIFSKIPNSYKTMT